MIAQTLTFLEKTLLEEFSQDTPRSLSQIARDLGMSDPSAIVYHIKKLIRDGRLVRIKKGQYRTVSFDLPEVENLIPFYGKGKCGPDGFFLEDSPEYHIPVSVQLMRADTDKVFALEAAGDSMSPVIEEGDLIFARKIETAETDGMYVVSHDGEILIKKVAIIDQKQGKGVLVSVNPSTPPITIDPDQFRVIGKVVTIIRRVSM
jgi:SOS-response transcriptional repressor LexA